MIKIISPNQFKKIPWKNGKGMTTELAISEGGTISEFDWRLSIASVVEDGEFSDFTGYMRHLVLIEGNGIELHHDGTKIDKLETILDVAAFDGGRKTMGVLQAGPITDFNLMTKTGRIEPIVETYRAYQEIQLKSCDLCFVYGVTDQLELVQINENVNQAVPAGHLIQIETPMVGQLAVKGQNLLVIYLNSSV